MKKLTSLILVLAIAFSFAGCSTSNSGDNSSDTETSSGNQASEIEIPSEAKENIVSYVTDGKMKASDIAMTVNGQEIDVMTYLRWIGTYLSELEYNYSFMGETYLDLSTELSDGYTIEQYIIDLAENDLICYALCEQQFNAESLSLSEEDEAEISAYVSELTDVDYAYGITDETHEESIYQWYSIYETLYDHIAEENAPTDTELQSFYHDKGYSTCRYVSIGSDDSSEKTEEERAQELYNSLSGLSTEEMSEKLDEYADDNNGIVSDVIAVNEDTETVDGMADAVSALSIGEASVQGNDDDGYYVVVRMEDDYSSVSDDYDDNTFSEQMEGWIEDSEVERKEILDDLDMETLKGHIDELSDLIYGDSGVTVTSGADTSAEGE